MNDALIVGGTLALCLTGAGAWGLLQRYLLQCDEDDTEEE